MAIGRVTQAGMSRNALDGLQRSMTRLQRVQEQLSSGKQVSKPSDSPSGTLTAMQSRSAIRRQEQFVRNAQDGAAWLGTADRALTNSLDLIRRVRELVVTGANDGAMDPAGRAALAEEVDMARLGLFSEAGTEYMGKPVFAGTSDSAVVFDSAGVYQGNSGLVERTLAPGVQMEVNIPGDDVFGSGATGVFALLSDIAAHLRSALPADHALLGTTDLDALDAASEMILNAVGATGARYNRVERLQSKAEDTILALRSQLSESEDLDLPKAITDMQLQEVAYQAALGATARVLQPSLLDFLR